MSKHPNQAVFIPLNKLSASPLNVRRTNKKADIEALAASIAAHGLLQNLSVVQSRDDRYEVIAGARRLAALKLLAKSGTIAKDFLVPCVIINPEDAGEASLAENLQRVAMDAMDEVDAFAALIETGVSVEDIARRFGCGARHVAQRLALSKLSPKLKLAYRRGDLSLDAARAFCIVDDHAKQEDVFKALGRHVTHPGSVRNHLMRGVMRTNDSVARFVGLEAYEQAGGRITRDLFDEDLVFVDDAALMSRLAHDRLEPFRNTLLDKGWGWVTINLGLQRFDGAASERLQHSRKPLTDQERDVLSAVESEIDELDDALAEASEDDPRWQQYEELTKRRQAVLDASLEWNADLMKLAGVVISLDTFGEIRLEHGIVRKCDAAQFRRLSKEIGGRAREATLSELNAANDADAKDRQDFFGLALSRCVIRDLTLVRSEALQTKLRESPDIALAVTVFVMQRQLEAGLFTSGIDLTIRASNLRSGNVQALAVDQPRHFNYLYSLDWLISQGRDALAAMLAELVANIVDLSHEGSNPADQQKQDLADTLARALDLDMRAHWKADQAFLMRLPKSAIIKAYLSAPCNASMTEDQIAEFIASHSKRRKDDIAKSAADALEGTNWLPDLLVTPCARGTFEVTAEGCNAISAA